VGLQLKPAPITEMFSFLCWILAITSSFVSFFYVLHF
jgi:hypothetical protein